MLILKPRNWRLPPEFVVSGSGPKPQRVFDLTSARESQECQLKNGFLLHRLLHLLTEDLYQPLTLGKIFSRLFNGEYFDPNSSPDRVHQVVKRLRAWLRSEKIPLDIQEAGGFYRLTWFGSYGLLKTAGGGRPDRNQWIFEQIAAHAPGGEFTAAWACRLIGLSRSAFNRWSLWARHSGRISGQTCGRGSTYRVKSIIT